MQRTVVFDADDTLWDEQGVLQSFEQRLEKRLDELTDTPTRFAKRFVSTENENIPSIGYGFPSYAFSLAEALSADPVLYAHKAAVLDIVRELFDTVSIQSPSVFTGTTQSLETLQRLNFRLALLTRGIEFEQRSKLRRSGLEPYFAGNIHIVQAKHATTYRTVAEQLGDPTGKSLCMVGNSFRSDIAPALEAGWSAVHVPAQIEWNHDAGESEVHQRAHRVSSIEEVPKLVSSVVIWQ